MLFLLLYGIKYKKPGQYFDDNMSISQTSAINGFFVAIIFFQHFQTYISHNVYDKTYLSLPIVTTQLIVVSFLFFSGYGLMESKKKKGYSYIKKLPTQRFLKVYFEFAIAICLFLLTNWILGTTFSAKRILLSFVGWDTVGNSNWYMFATFWFYIIMYISFIFCKKLPDIVPVIITTILSIGYIVTLSFFRMGYWYSTFICLPIGMIFSLYKDYIFAFLKMRKLHYYLSLSLCVAAFVLLYIFALNNPHLHNLMSIFFAFIIVLVTMKFSIQNKYLLWLGKNTFWVYILQRIPMMIFKHLGFAAYPYLFMWLAALGTLALVLIVKYPVGYLEKLIWRTKKSQPLQTEIKEKTS